MKEGQVLFCLTIEGEPDINVKDYIQAMFSTAAQFGKVVSFLAKGPGEQVEELRSIDQLSWEQQRIELGKAVTRMRVRFDILIKDAAASIGIAASVLGKLEQGTGPVKLRSMAAMLRKVVNAFPADQTLELREMMRRVFGS